MKALIVDSSLQIVQRLEEMLLTTKATSAVFISDNYENGLQLFNENKPDIVLIGISLPEDRSIKLLVEIKTMVYKIPVIILSASMHSYIHHQCRLLGADYILDKYYEFEKIPAVINGIAGIAGKYR